MELLKLLGGAFGEFLLVKVLPFILVILFFILILDFTGLAVDQTISYPQ